ncbi:MAG: hypothetical protein F9K23_11525 [Bacteroidetes bacterium]|nr:MAG: hypothetical protein F9K23_11525 [Bacteroidota bacterium]
MKKLFLLIAVAFIYGKAAGQTDELNHKKYWDLRDRYKKYFTCIGKEQGMSIPIPTRSESFWASPNSAATLYYGDATSSLGWYIGVLATEYYLLKEYGHNAEAQTTLNELYYAIAAVNRLDRRAEPYLSQNTQGENLNGFYLRDDVGESYWDNWNNSDNKYLNDNIQYKTVLSDFFHNSTLNPDPGKFNPENEPSQDQHIALMMGFLFVKELVGSITVQPTPQDAPLNLLSEVQSITNRIMAQLQGFTELGENMYFDFVMPGYLPCAHTKKFKSNYTIKSPVDGSIAAGENSYYIFLQGYPICQLATAVTGAQYNWDYQYGWDVDGCDLAQPRTFSMDYDELATFNFDELWFTTAGWMTTVPLAPIGATVAFGLLDNVNDMSLDELWHQLENAAQPDGSYQFAGFSNAPPDPDVNFQMHLNLASTTNTWQRDKVQEVARGMNQEVFILMYDFFKKIREFGNRPSGVRYTSGTTIPPSAIGNLFDYKEEMKAILDPMDCKGSFLMDATNRAAGGWDVGHRWLHSTKSPSEKAKSENQRSHYHSLDYMMLYNLYHIAYGLEGIRIYDATTLSFTNTSVTMPDYNPLVTCPCTDITLNLTQPLETTKEIIPRFNHYRDFGVELNEYVNTDWSISTATGLLKNKNTTLVVCNNSTLTVTNNGRLQIGDNATGVGGFMIVRSGSTLTLEDGLLIVENTGRIVIEKGATLKISTANQIMLNGSNAVIEILGNLELLPNATLNPLGEGYILFNLPSDNNNLPNITVNGNNCQMIFEDATGAKRIEIASHTRLHPPKNLKLFKIEGIKAELGLNASMVLPCDFHIVNNTITRIPTVTDNNGNTRIHKGITIYGILHPQYITDNTFSDAKTAFTILNPQGHYDIKIHYNDFINCDYGVQVRNGRTHIFANEFIDCGQAVQAVDFARTLRFESNTVKGAGNNPTGFGFEITSANYADVGITGNVFSKTVTGFHGDKAVATLACNHFYQNDQAIDFYNYGSLNISASVPSTGISLVGGSPLNGGYNYLNIPSGKNGAKVTSPYGLLRPFFLTTQIDNGYNSFYNVGSSNPQYSSLVITRPSNTLNTSIQDLTINNNYWGPQANVAYVAPPLPPNFISVNNAGSIHFAINENYTPRYILGIQSATTTTCPISAWTSALSDPLNFDPDTKKPPVGGGATLNIYRNGSVLSSFDGNFGGISTTENVPNGTYMGTNVKTAFRNVFTGFTQTVPLSGGGSEEVVLKQGLLNLANLLTAASSLISPETKEMNVFGYQKYLASIGDAIGAQVFVGDAAGVANQLLAANTLFDQLNTVNDAVNTNDTPHYRVKFNIELDRMIVHWMFGKYADALEINSNISTFVQTDDIDRLNYWNCIIENERKVIAEEITELEYAENLKTCAMLFPYQPLQGYGLNGGSQGGGGSSEPNVTFTLTPNPATDVITVNMDMNVDGEVRLAVFNKFGIKVVNDIPLGELLAGNHSHTVAIAGLPIDVYNMVVYVDNAPFVEHFIKNNE